jgi:hypothetical protein
MAGPHDEESVISYTRRELDPTSQVVHRVGQSLQGLW